MAGPIFDPGWDEHFGEPIVIDDPETGVPRIGRIETDHGMFPWGRNGVTWVAIPLTVLTGLGAAADTPSTVDAPPDGRDVEWDDVEKEKPEKGVVKIKDVYEAIDAEVTAAKVGELLGIYYEKFLLKWFNLPPLPFSKQFGRSLAVRLKLRIAKKRLRFDKPRERVTESIYRRVN